MRRAVVLVVVVMAFAVTLPAYAQKANIGVSAGRTTLKDDGAGLAFDASDTGWKVFLGYRILKNLGIEVEYADLGKFDQTVNDVRFEGEAQATSLYLSGVWPVTLKARVEGKVGWSLWDARSTFDDGMMPPEVDSGDGSDFTWAFLFGYNITERFGFRLEWQNYQFANVDDTTFISVGIQFNF